MRRVCLLLLGFLLISSCSVDRRAAGPVAKYLVEHRSRTFGTCDSTDTPCVTVRFSYPALQDGMPPGVRDSIRAYIDGLMFASLDNRRSAIPFDTLVEELVQQYRSLRKEFPDYSLPWSLERTMSFLADTGGIVSLRFEESSFLGGAHGMETVRLASFDASLGARLRLEQIFLPGFEGALVAEVGRAFRRVRQVPEGQTLADAGFWIEEGRFPLGTNFAIDAGDIVFYYNAYEIAPYALGPTEVHVGFDGLAAIIDRKGVLGRWAR
jgi:hypothetical protein